MRLPILQKLVSPATPYLLAGAVGLSPATQARAQAAAQSVTLDTISVESQGPARGRAGLSGSSAGEESAYGPVPGYLERFRFGLSRRGGVHAAGGG